MGTWLLMTFVLTPLTAIIELLYVGIGFGIYYIAGFEIDNVGTGIGILLVSLALLIVVNKITRLVRYGGNPDGDYFFVDLILGPLRFPFILVADVIAFFCIFSDGLDIDDECDFVSDGIISCLVSYLLFVDISDFTDGVKDFIFENPVLHRIKVILYQLFTWGITALHSFVAFSLVMSNSLNEQKQTMMVVLMLLYIPICGLSAMLKGATLTYDIPAQRRTVEVKGHFENGKFVPDEEKTETENGYITKITIGTVLYIITGLIWIFPQTIVLLLSLFVPSKGRVVFCTPDEFERLGVGELGAGGKILYMLFGFVVTDYPTPICKERPTRNSRPINWLVFVILTILSPYFGLVYLIVKAQTRRTKTVCGVILGVLVAVPIIMLIISSCI